MDRWLVPARLLAQEIAAPEPGREVYWIAGLLAIACLALAREVLKRIDQLMTVKDAETTEWKGQAKTLLPELVKANASLGTMVETVDRAHGSTVEVVEDLAAVAAAVQNLATAMDRVETRLQTIEDDKPPRRTPTRRAGP